MFASRPRGSRIIYVAASARELPDEVQQWLGQAEHRAASSPHIYDALALLASGAKPAVMIVSIDGVDWSEMEFFDQATRISRDTHVYVTGHGHQAVKLEAACKRGASLFDEEALGNDLAGSASGGRAAGISDILAASLAPAGQPPVAVVAAPIKPVPAEPPEPEEPGLPAEESLPDLVGEAPSPVEPASKPEPVAAEPPVVRLITPTEAETPEEESHKPIPFPWAPSPARPQRIPPKARPAGGEPVAPAPSELPLAAAPTVAPRQPVELTAEELSALMGRPISSEKPAREGTG